MSSHPQPDPTNGIVIIPKASTARNVYHTRECSHYPDSPHTRKLSSLDGFRPCKFCVRTVNTGEYTCLTPCPFCGEHAQLRSHLPCEAQP